MLNFWRLDTKDKDFILVDPPSWAIAPKIRAYHLELLNRIRYLTNHHLVESDEVIFPAFTNYYGKVAQLMGIDSDSLLPASRHSFFIACESRGDFWISGLELLMGYDFQEAGGQGGRGAGGVSVTSGEYEIDVLAELLLLPDTSQTQWLASTKSPQYLAKLTKQIGDRLRGKEAIEELQREQDLKILESSNATEQLKKAGFSL